MTAENVAEKVSEQEAETITVVEEVIDDNVNLTEKADDIVSGANPEAEEAIHVDIIDSDCDVYIFTYWDNEKKSKAQEAINYIEGKLKEKFIKNKVKESDQVFNFFEIESLGENEIQLKVKMKKNNWPVEKSARNVQTSGLDSPFSVSIKTIQR